MTEGDCPMRSSAPVLLVLSSTYPRWAGDPEPGFVHELSKRLVSCFRVVVLCPHAAGAMPRETLDGVEVIRYRYAPQRLESLVNDGGIAANLRRHKWKFLLVPTFLLAQAWMTLRLLRKEGVNVIHAHWLLPQGLIAALLHSLPGRKVPFVVTSHGADLYVLRGRVMDTMKRFVLRTAAAATVVSRAMRDALHATGSELSKISVQPMGVDLHDRFFPDPTVTRSTCELLFVGRLVEKKGLRHLIDAMPAILATHPAANLTIAGFGPEEPALRAQVTALGLKDKVAFAGAVPQSELPALYRRAAVFVAPFVQAVSGDQEGLGLVLVEAIGCSCPVVAGDVPAVRDVLGGRSGSCVNPAEPGRLADAIVAVLDDPPAAREEASRLRDALVGRLDWRNVADGYARMLLAVGCRDPSEDA